jgi:hypothetical protein
MSTAIHTPLKPIQKLQARMARLAERESGAVDKRLAELEREWTIGGLVKVTLGGLVFLGVTMTMVVSAWWLLIVVAAGMMLAQKYCMEESWLDETFAFCGYRTSTQIASERTALLLRRREYQIPPVTMHVEISQVVRSQPIVKEETISLQTDVTLQSQAVPMLVS